MSSDLMKNTSLVHRRDRGKIVALACGVTMSLPGSLEARLLAPTTPAIDIEVNIASDISDASMLSTWVSEEAREAVVATSRDEVRRGLIRIDVTGNLYDYDVTMTTTREAESVGSKSSWNCECTNEELLARLRTELPLAADRLVVQQSLPVPKKTPKPPQAYEVVDHQQKRPALGPVGGAGVALIATGLVGAIGGAVLAARGVEVTPGNTRGREHEVHDYRSPGLTVVAGGAGLALAGIVMILLRDKRHGKSTSARSKTLGDRFGAMISGRF